MKELERKGKLSQFASTDLCRMYEVVDEFYDEYLERTSKTRPPDDQTMAEFSTIEKADDQKLRKDLRLKLQEEAKCVNMLEIKNRKRIQELSESLQIKKRKRAL